MKTSKNLIILLVIFIFSNCSNKDEIKSNETKDKAKLLETITEFNTAFKECDIPKLESMITDNYQHTNGNSKSIGKNEWLKYLHKRKDDIESGLLKVMTYEMDQTTIQFYESTAIVTARIIVTSYKLEEQQENEYRITNIWVKENGDWKRAGFHDGKIR